MKKYTICITTFEAREKLATDFIKYISEHAPEYNILVAVNGNNENKVNEEYRKKFLSFCSNIPNCFPIFCPEFKSLAKLWNTLVIFSDTEHNLICNDDISITNPITFKNIQNVLDNTSHEFFTINGSFSHFVITKSILHELNYFDERLIAFGEEDGDMVYQYISKYKKQIPVFKIDGFHNVHAYSQSDPNLEVHIDNKPKFNREFISLKYTHDKDGIYGMSPIPVKQIIGNIQQYPYEMFNIKNRHNIKKYTNIDPQY
jgi:hypothetical protein